MPENVPVIKKEKRKEHQEVGAGIQAWMHKATVVHWQTKERVKETAM